MSYSIEINEKACNGYGNCIVAAPEVFDLDPETNIAVIRAGGNSETADDEELEEAAADCPVRAITLRRP
ncbi:ferredoxin [Amycolatopsis jiangsuensis]|uniref:Ferredoxin n=1 Tax=Amycolatopsis jiangsuensis TaxID=1181879 RepID=A0A840J3L8_9PSEU|nr:ferredoxin [Amycolatopsis jiangsuensis]MBB4689676.1 ferredoxin [Amycolatopsis jiangsuensis]